MWYITRRTNANNGSISSPSSNFYSERRRFHPPEKGGLTELALPRSPYRVIPTRSRNAGGGMRDFNGRNKEDIEFGKSPALWKE